MYLVCCPNMQIEPLLNDLSKIDVIGLPLRLMDLEFDMGSIKFLEDNINRFDYVVIMSPAVIDVIKHIIMKATLPKFITVGITSATKIKKITTQEVIYPIEESGNEALFNEQMINLDLPNKKIMIIKGDGGSSEFYTQMNKYNIKWTNLEIYRRVLLDIEPNYFKKTLLVNNIEGIIITTSTLVEWLFIQAKRALCLNLLKECLFITLHQQIEKKLFEFGASRVLVTPIADRNAIIKLIKNNNEKIIY